MATFVEVPTLLEEVQPLEFDLSDGSSPEVLDGEAHASSFQLTDRGTLETRDRHVLWRSKGNMLELVDYSSHADLNDCAASFCLPDAILPTVGLADTGSSVNLFVTMANNTVYCLSLGHPDHVDGGSIFCNWDPRTSIHQPFEADGHTLTCTAVLDASTVALGTSSGAIVVVVFPPLGSEEEPEEIMLRETSLLSRLVSGFMPFSQGDDLSTAVVDICAARTRDNDGDDDHLVVAVTMDRRLLVWSARARTCQALQATDRSADRLYVDCSAGENGDVIISVLIYHEEEGTELLLFEHVDGKTAAAAALPCAHAGAPVDMCVTPARVWLMVREQGGEHTILSAMLRRERGNSSACTWSTVTPSRSPLLIPDVAGMNGVGFDVHDAYVDRLLSPSLALSPFAIVQGVSLFLQGHDEQAEVSTRLLREDLSLLQLKQELLYMIQEMVRMQDPEPESAKDIAADLWETLMQNCIKAHLEHDDALGLGCTCHGGIFVITATSASYIQEMRGPEALGLVLLSSPPSGRPFPLSVITSALNTDPTAAAPMENASKVVPLSAARARDLGALLGCILGLTGHIGEEPLAAFGEELRFKVQPVTAAYAMLSNLLSEGEGEGRSAAASQFARQFRCVRKPIEAYGHLVDVCSAFSAQPGNNAVGASTFNVRLASEYALRTAHGRYVLLRGALVSLCMLVRLRHPSGLTSRALDHVMGSLIPHVSALVASYHALMVACDTPLAIEAAQPGSVWDRRPPHTITSAFLSAWMEQYGDTLGAPCGMAVASAALGALSDMLPLGADGGLTSSGVNAANFLALIGATGERLEWCRLVGSDAAHGGAAALMYIRGCALAEQGDQLPRAADLLRAAVQGAERNDSLLLQAIGGESARQIEEAERAEQRALAYYIHVIRMFESTRQMDIVVSFAREALARIPADDPHLQEESGWLHASVFKHTLSLRSYDDAYLAILANPIPSRRRDCLRRFVVVLCERGQVAALCAYPFLGLQEEVESTLARRAAQSDLDVSSTQPPYYRILYAFHSTRQNYRQAATVMFDYAQRLASEAHSGLGALEAQTASYLAAINTLHLVEPHNAWIVSARPPEAQDSASGKRRRSDPAEQSKSLLLPPPPQTLAVARARGVDVIELKDLEQRYLLAKARGELARPRHGWQQDSAEEAVVGSALSPVDAVSLLARAGIVDLAVTISLSFSLCLSPVFDSIAAKCVQLQLGAADASVAQEPWLEECRGGDVSNAAWSALCRLLRSHDTNETKFRYHACVADKVLKLDNRMRLHLSFYKSYERVHAAGLLRIFIKHSLWDEASVLATTVLQKSAESLLSSRANCRACGKHQEEGAVCQCALLEFVNLPFNLVDVLEGGLKQRLEMAQHEATGRSIGRAGVSHRLTTQLQSLQEAISNYLAASARPCRA